MVSGMGFLSRCICAMGGYGGMGIERNMDMDVDMDMGWAWDGAPRGIGRRYMRLCVSGCVGACSRVYMVYVDDGCMQHRKRKSVWLLMQDD